MTADPLLGTFVGRYRVVRILGKGGMGRVYLAEQPEIGSRVAIKVLAEEFVDSPELTERFFREARTVNLIRHEHIINVLDLDRLPNGRPFIVMEHIDGCSLRDVLEAGVAPLGGVLHVMSEVLSALDAAHAAGVVHRDLKPDNVMITPAGRTKVLDFGIAKLADDPTQPRTRTGTSLGTPHYMAPEQILGASVDARCDVYAAGIMLFELATGTRPFGGATDFHLMEGHLRGTPPSARALRPAVPDALEAVIAQALAKAPADRFQSARAMAHAIRQAAAELPPSEWRPLTVAQPSVSFDALPVIADSAEAATVPGRRSDRALKGRLDEGTQDVAAPPQHATAPLPNIRPQALQLPPPGVAEQAATVRPSIPAIASRRRAVAVAIAAAALVLVVVVVVAMTRESKSQVTRDAGDTIAQAPVADSSADIDAALDATVVVTPGDARAVDAKEWAGWTQPRPSDAGTKTSKPSIDAAIAAEPTTSWDGGLAKKIDYDPKRFDASKYLARATALARLVTPDATLTEMTVPWVYPDGHVELGFSENPAYTFRSASGAQPCVVIVFPGKTSVTVGPREEKPCRKPAGAPRCSVAQLLARAKTMGAPVDPIPGGGYGPRNFVTWDEGKWRVSIMDKTHTQKFREELDDKCN